MPGFRIHITGIVQGVGMRPHVYREAVAAGVAGWVLNAGDGVHIEAWGDEARVADFIRNLHDQAPAAALIEGIEVEGIDDADGTQAPISFSIVPSTEGAARTTLVSPDIATCPDCVRELFDPADRRYRYPFINCTNCGPRFTIIRSLPYDRPATSMAAFPMCPACAAEYADPLDRRFHAQPDACFSCGPHLTWRERGQDEARVGTDRMASDEIIGRAAELLARGGIIAIKGIGGFHLACDAGDEAAVTELRRRKRRGRKPLAVMVRGLEAAEALCVLDDTERALLAGSARPIVLARRRGGRGGATGSATRREDVPAIAPAVARDLPELGIVLPYTPLQHLLMADCAARGVRALVMTSGNISQEPIETDDALAWERLVASGLADALLGNDRAILSRYDDSVARVVGGTAMPVRRARGYAPMPLALPPQAGAPGVLACGSEQKATLALTRGDEGFLSQHIGDVENAPTLASWHEARTRLEGLFDLSAGALACDLHPSYLTSRWARERTRETALPLVEVQHHHAHIAATMAEAIGAGTLAPDARVAGIALDGTGAGTDGTVWGSEIMVAGLAGYERIAHLAPWRLPGGAASVRDARRSALALLMACGLEGHPGAARLIEGMDGPLRAVTARMVERGINSPWTSSMGRLLDAFAALTGICPQAGYEGEPAIELEAAARRARRPERAAGRGGRYAFARRAVEPDGSPEAIDARERVGEHAATMIELDPAPLVRAALDDLAAGAGAPEVALLVHEAVAREVAQVALDAARERGIDAIALSGGVFMNRLILERVRGLIEDAGLTALVPTTAPVNDGCIAYGQAAVARARLGAKVGEGPNATRGA